MAGKAERLDRGDGRRHAEGFGRFGQADDIVLQHLTVNRLNVESHLRLLIDKNKLAVLRGEQFKFAGHVKSLFRFEKDWVGFRKAGAGGEAAQQKEDCAVPLLDTVVPFHAELCRKTRNTK